MFMKTSAWFSWTLNVLAMGTQLVLRRWVEINIPLGWKVNRVAWLTPALHQQTALALVPVSLGSLLFSRSCKVHSYPSCLLVPKPYVNPVLPLLCLCMFSIA